MPSLSLVVCVFNERVLLQRLLEQAQGCYDDLVVVHDGPDETNVRAVVEAAGGAFFEAPRAYQQEPHWPFAWGQARHDWILRLDADEFPSEELKTWLKEFRHAPEPAPEVSGYTCIWPLWDGKRMVTRRWPSGRIFLFDRQKVRFFGMVEQVPIPDGIYEPVDLILNHQPARKSYGLEYVFFRKQFHQWKHLIARSLLGMPTDLPCWRWSSDKWPPTWEGIRQSPLRTGIFRFFVGLRRTLLDQWKREGKILPNAALFGPVHHLAICLTYWKLARTTRSQSNLNLDAARSDPSKVP